MENSINLDKVEKMGLVCGKWRMPFLKEPESEEHKDYSSRSFLHYFAQEIPVVDAKARATHWVLDGLPQMDEVMEFFGGAGLSSLIIQGLLKPKTHWIGEYADVCVDHLRNMFSNDKVSVVKCDAFEAMRCPISVPDGGKFAIFMDYPVFSGLRLKQHRYMNCWRNIFSSKPDIVGFADTALSRFWAHRAKYTRYFGDSVKERIDYFKGLSALTMREFGYSIVKVANRANKVTYNILKPGKHEIEMKKFEEINEGKGFKWLENRWEWED